MLGKVFAVGMVVGIVSVGGSRSCRDSCSDVLAVVSGSSHCGGLLYVAWLAFAFMLSLMFMLSPSGKCI